MNLVHTVKLIWIRGSAGQHTSARYIELQGWSWAYWEFSAGFGIYNPSDNSYNDRLIDALLHNEMPEPARYVGTAVYTSQFDQTISDWNIAANNGAAATITQNAEKS